PPARIPEPLHASQYVADLSRPGRLRRRHAVLHRPVGTAVPAAAFRAVIDASRRRLLGDDRLLGGGEPARRVLLGSHRTPQADLSRRGAPLGGRLGAALLPAPPPPPLRPRRRPHPPRARPPRPCVCGP